MPRRPTFSLIVPTRRRPAQLRRFLDSVAATASDPNGIEVVLVVDADDPASIAADHPSLALRHVVVPPGRTMGAINRAGYEASAGDYVMLLNDDVIARTPGWDATALACFRRFPDPIVLVHVNDTLFRDRLCTFPLTTRAFCERAGGICPPEYIRYRIDDHIEDVFNLLAVLGRRRTVYLPDVVFQHYNLIERPEGDRVYASDPAVLALDAPRFAALFPRARSWPCGCSMSSRAVPTLASRRRPADAGRHRRPVRPAHVGPSVRGAGAVAAAPGRPAARLDGSGRGAARPRPGPRPKGRLWRTGGGDRAAVHTAVGRGAGGDLTGRAGGVSWYPATS